MRIRRIAVLIDGGFFVKRLSSWSNRAFAMRLNPWPNLPGCSANGTFRS